MATIYKVLGQSNPSATTATTLYTVPAATSTVLSTLVITNRAGATSTYRVAIRPAGATLSNEHYIVYDSTLAVNDAVFLTLGITLATTDVVTVYTSAATTTFSAYGSEIS
jgi:hypothetical protein